MITQLHDVTSYITTFDNIVIKGIYNDDNNYIREVECKLLTIDRINEMFICESVRTNNENNLFYAKWYEMDIDSLIRSFIISVHECPRIEYINVAQTIPNGVNTMDYGKMVVFSSETEYVYIYKGFIDLSAPGQRMFERKPTLFRHEDVHRTTYTIVPLSHENYNLFFNIQRRVARENQENLRNEPNTQTTTAEVSSSNTTEYIDSNTITAVDFQTDSQIYNWGMEEEELEMTEEDVEEMNMAMGAFFWTVNNTVIPQNYVFEDVKVLLTDRQFKKICGIKKSDNSYCYRKMGPKLINDMKIDSNINCAICSDKIERWDKVAITPCKHIFHAKCAKQWFTKMCPKPTCPNCRHDIRDPVK